MRNGEEINFAKKFFDAHVRAKGEGEGAGEREGEGEGEGAGEGEGEGPWRVRVRVAAGLTEPTWLSPWLLSARTVQSCV